MILNIFKAMRDQPTPHTVLAIKLACIDDLQKVMICRICPHRCIRNYFNSRKIFLDFKYLLYHAKSTHKIHLMFKLNGFWRHSVFTVTWFLASGALYWGMISKEMQGIYRGAIFLKEFSPIYLGSGYPSFPSGSWSASQDCVKAVAY